MRSHHFKPDKRGAVTVFLSIALAGLLSAVIVFSINAREEAEESYRRAILDLSSRSVLSEYDRRLFNDYGIVAFRGSNKYIEKQLMFYIKHTDIYSNNAFSLDLTLLDADTEGFEITNIDTFEDQIIKAAMYDKVSVFERQNQTEDTDDSLVTSIMIPENTGVIDTGKLPSSMNKEKGFEIDIPEIKSGGLKGLIAETGDKFLVNQYIFEHFNHLRSDNTAESFLSYEIEYIISGCSTDIENLDRVHKYFVALRTPVNIARIYADPAKVSAALAEAELLTPGPAVVATQALIIAAWAAEDAENEWDMVRRGMSVDALYYHDYLMIFLTLEDRDIKLLRMMDLIQVNLNNYYYDTFRISEFYTGFSVLAEFDDDEIMITHNY
ncbi:MAG: hypothetical protein E7225_02475 [Clostridiales bacterium]|nr:hypothetical protein [Clostridiales bacterium]